MQARRRVDDAINETQEAPCESSYLYLMRALTGVMTPGKLLVSERVIVEYEQSLKSSKNHKETCDVITSHSSNVIHGITAEAAYGAAVNRGNPRANALVTSSFQRFQMFSHLLLTCKNTHNVEPAVRLADEHQEMLREFNKLHAQCVRENSKRFTK